MNISAQVSCTDTATGQEWRYTLTLGNPPSGTTLEQAEALAANLLHLCAAQATGPVIEEQDIDIDDDSDPLIPNPS